MAHRGSKPSTGCQRCRARKVKCDETRPICQRCSKSDHECVFRDSFDMLLRDQNRDAEMRATQKWRARAGNSGQTSRSRSSDEGSLPIRKLSKPTYTTSDAVYLRCNSPLTTPIGELAINRFFYDYVVLPPQDNPYSLKGYLPFLPKLYFGCSPVAALSTAVMSVAMANFAGRVNSSKVESCGRQQYSNALMLTKEALADPALSRSDETLASIYLLSMYEIVQFPKHNRGSWSVHLEGAIAFARMRADHKSPNILSPTGNWICRLVTWQMLMKYSRDGIHPPGDRGEWLGLWKNLNFAEATLANLQYRAVDLNASILSQNSAIDLATWEIKLELESLNFALDSWEVEWRADHEFEVQPSDFEAKPQWLAEIVDFEGKPPVVHKYQKLFAIVSWNLFRATRLRIELARWERHDLYDSQTDRMASLKRMIALMEDICASVQCCFTVPIEGKPTAVDSRDVCSVRSMAILHPLLLAARSLRGPLEDLPGMRERMGWVQVVLEHMQHNFSVSGSVGGYKAGRM